MSASILQFPRRAHSPVAPFPFHLRAEIALSGLLWRVRHALARLVTRAKAVRA